MVFLLVLRKIWVKYHIPRLEINMVNTVPDCLSFSSSRRNQAPISRAGWLWHLWLDSKHHSLHERQVHQPQHQSDIIKYYLSQPLKVFFFNLIKKEKDCLFCFILHLYLFDRTKVFFYCWKKSTISQHIYEVSKVTAMMVTHDIKLFYDRKMFSVVFQTES